MSNGPSYSTLKNPSTLFSSIDDMPMSIKIFSTLFLLKGFDPLVPKNLIYLKLL
jgi:hypothetical protein